MANFFPGPIRIAVWLRGDARWLALCCCRRNRRQPSSASIQLRRICRKTTLGNTSGRTFSWSCQEHERKVWSGNAYVRKAHMSDTRHGLRRRLDGLFNAQLASAWRALSVCFCCAGVAVLPPRRAEKEGWERRSGKIPAATQALKGCSHARRAGRGRVLRSPDPR